MISSLSGDIQARGASHVVVAVSGVGIRVFVPARTAALCRVGEETQLHTTLIVREDDLSLYGFTTEEERDAFDLLCGVNGVGPKSALGVLSALTVEEIAQAVEADDDAVFRQVSGIGPKTAKLITLSLSGKIHSSAPAVTAPGPGDSRLSPSEHSSIVQALVGLGWSEKVAKKGLSDVLESLGEADDTSVPALVRRALLVLGPQTVRDPSR